MNIRNVCDFDTMLQYFGENLEWSIDTEDFSVDNYSYEVYVLVKQNCNSTVQSN